MSLATMLENIGVFIAGFFFWPLKLLSLIGSKFVSCGDMGWVGLTAAALGNAVEWLRFTYPVIRFLPWGFIWSFLWALVMWQLVKLVWRNFPWLTEFVRGWWLPIVVFWILGGIITWFIGSDWASDPNFTEVFGTTPSSTYSGGGGGGGGGGSW